MINALDSDGEEGETRQREALDHLIVEVQEFVSTIFRALDDGLAKLLAQGGPCQADVNRPEFVVAFEEGLAPATIHGAGKELRKVLERVFLLRVQVSLGLPVDLKFIQGRTNG